MISLRLISLRLISWRLMRLRLMRLRLNNWLEGCVAIAQRGAWPCQRQLAASDWHTTCSVTWGHGSYVITSRLWPSCQQLLMANHQRDFAAGNLTGSTG
jgi:hypothetical protein